MLSNSKFRGIPILITVLLIAFSAQLSWELPIGNGIPFTGQSLAVLIFCSFLSPIEALLALSIYFILGILGFPFFADGSSGWEQVMSGSGGFIYGFIFAGITVAYLMQIGWKENLLLIFLALLIASIILFIFGLGHLAVKNNVSVALEYGFFPFWKGALLKVVVGALVVFALEKLWAIRMQNQRS